MAALLAQAADAIAERVASVRPDDPAQLATRELCELASVLQLELPVLCLLRSRGPCRDKATCGSERVEDALAALSTAMEANLEPPDEEGVECPHPWAARRALMEKPDLAMGDVAAGAAVLSALQQDELHLARHFLRCVEGLSREWSSTR